MASDHDTDPWYIVGATLDSHHAHCWPGALRPIATLYTPCVSDKEEYGLLSKKVALWNLEKGPKLDISSPAPIQHVENPPSEPPKASVLRYPSARLAGWYRDLRAIAQTTLGRHLRQPRLLLCNASPTSLNGLPNELLHMILTALPPHSQLSLRQSSRWLYLPFQSAPLTGSERLAFAQLVRRDIFHKALAEGPSKRQLLLGLNPCLECRTMHEQRAFSLQQMCLPYQERRCKASQRRIVLCQHESFSYAEIRTMLSNLTESRWSLATRCTMSCGAINIICRHSSHLETYDATSTTLQYVTLRVLFDETDKLREIRTAQHYLVSKSCNTKTTYCSHKKQYNQILCPHQRTCAPSNARVACDFTRYMLNIEALSDSRQPFPTHLNDGSCRYCDCRSWCTYQLTQPDTKENKRWRRACERYNLFFHVERMRMKLPINTPQDDEWIRVSTLDDDEA
ncbi:hypothetical protein KC342_g73 [Hortaea werneckii]|nr:hypothetical protein KC342_g73 [Hortaea werneckii]